MSFAIGMSLPAKLCGVVRLPSVMFTDLVVELGVPTVSGALIKLHGVVSLVPLPQTQFILDKQLVTTSKISEHVQ